MLSQHLSTLLLPILLTAISLCGAQRQLFVSNYAGDPEADMTVVGFKVHIGVLTSFTQPEIIRYWGYPVEVHHVVTRDGYVLELHRIPRGRNGESSF